MIKDRDSTIDQLSKSRPKASAAVKTNSAEAYPEAIESLKTQLGERDTRILALQVMIAFVQFPRRFLKSLLIRQRSR